MTAADEPEVWRPIPGFPSYDASNLGRIRSRKGPEPRILKASIGTTGYFRLAVSDDQRRHYSKNVHQLVALTFLGERPKEMDTRHLDGNKLNNRLSNLSYGTKRQNNLDTVAHGAHNHAKKTHCSRNHPYDEVNTLRTRRGRRECRTCSRLRNERYRRRLGIPARLPQAA